MTVRNEQKCKYKTCLPVVLRSFEPFVAESRWAFLAPKGKLYLIQDNYTATFLRLPENLIGYLSCFFLNINQVKHMN